jgi:hypothetical protein
LKFEKWELEYDYENCVFRQETDLDTITYLPGKNQEQTLTVRLLDMRLDSPRLGSSLMYDISCYLEYFKFDLQSTNLLEAKFRFSNLIHK